jgi:hypothetical protein
VGVYAGPEITSDGLVLALDAANTKSYPTSGGTTWTDLSGNGNNGTLVNGVAQDVGFLSFDGTNDYVDCGNTASLSAIAGTSNITVSGWVYYTAYGGGGQPYSVITVKGNPWTWLLENPSNTFNFRITAGGADVTVADTSTHLLNTWYNVVGTYDGSNMRIYVNGILKNIRAQTGTLGTNSETAKIGTYQGTNYNLTGRISNVSIYNRALSAAEIQQNYNAISSRTFTFLGSSLNPLSSPVQAQSLGYAAGNYYFKSGSMSSAQLLEYQPNYYESRPFCCVFRSPYASTATTNKIDLSIPMGGLLVQRDALDLRGAVYWSTPITYTTVGGAGNNTADSGTGYAGSNARRVILGNSGGHGIFNTGQSSCNWPSAAGAIGAGWDGGTCGSFPNGLIWGTGNGSTPTYDNRSGTWSHWITWS